ncbi:hypothetical protein LL065_19300 [Clostridium estertheticum]|nr:hypothetical protein [Clostridium estertheticum]WAG40391.1 hypothetical protein LL065_19300 [Clostridium estertheticum]
MENILEKINSVLSNKYVLSVNIVREPNFNKEYGLDGMYGNLWRPISMLKAVISDVESLINQEK